MQRMRQAVGTAQLPDRPQHPTETAGPRGGPVYSYRGAEIRCNRGGNVCTLMMPDHPPHGGSFAVVGTVTPLIDLWVEERQSPSYVRAVPKEGSRPVTE